MERLNELQGDLQASRDTVILANQLLAPTQFNGLSQESTRRFLRQFRKVADAQGWDDNKIMRTIPLYLAGTADIWFSAIPQDEKPVTFNNFAEQLRNQFDNDTFLRIAKQECHQLAQEKR